MRDALGRLWKVQDDQFMCYEKKGGAIREIARFDIAPPAGRHQGRGKGCGGNVYGDRWQICGKCAAEVRR